MRIGTQHDISCPVISDDGDAQTRFYLFTCMVILSLISNTRGVKN